MSLAMPGKLVQRVIEASTIMAGGTDRGVGRDGANAGGRYDENKAS
jgi:hypothetical protein